MDKPPLEIERLHDRRSYVWSQPDAGSQQTRDVHLRGGATFTDWIRDRNVVMPAWVVIYNERVGLPLTTGYPMLLNTTPSSSGFGTEVETRGGKLVDGLAAATFNVNRVRPHGRIGPNPLPGGRERKEEGN